MKTFTTEEIFRTALAQVKEEANLIGKEHAKIADEILNRFMTSLINKEGNR